MKALVRLMFDYFGTESISHRKPGIRLFNYPLGVSDCRGWNGNKFSFLK